MFFTEKEEENHTPTLSKFNELKDRFNVCITTSLEGIKPVQLSWSTPDLHKLRTSTVEMHPIYLETLDNIDQFINEIKFERRFRDRLSLAEKQKVIDAFIIPLYERKKTIYAHAIDYLQRATRFQQQRHPHVFKKETYSKCLEAIEEFQRQIKACDESIYDHKPAMCVNYCTIL